MIDYAENPWSNQAIVNLINGKTEKEEEGIIFLLFFHFLIHLNNQIITLYIPALNNLNGILFL